uniref:Chalcone isomerase domain-containing protein n=1 Tax=Chromera velia CCMP2878 TaxID=1169474 RepID=A0A0G4HV79_9ALVE|eukprot:Cvel_1387.t1-p1 / transcript=Cvel_1387.t1 / gene=Cvel_1387 / organism=Chromera_velia_CCMP2878 / gene_product=hypothetical protein / transcript_product=hypothetical protein / location=Cvel_scaffold48:53307-56628(+) / protein_length=798 / sequence_SO=supercontig / SO=protein_coding / is_pseudo=false
MVFGFLSSAFVAAALLCRVGSGFEFVEPQTGERFQSSYKGAKAGVVTPDERQPSLEGGVDVGLNFSLAGAGLWETEFLFQSHRQAAVALYVDPASAIGAAGSEARALPLFANETDLPDLTLRSSVLSLLRGTPLFDDLAKAKGDTSATAVRGRKGSPPKIISKMLEIRLLKATRGCDLVSSLGSALTRSGASHSDVLRFQSSLRSLFAQSTRGGPVSSHSSDPSSSSSWYCDEGGVEVKREGEGVPPVSQEEAESSDRPVEGTETGRELRRRMMGEGSEEDREEKTDPTKIKQPMEGLFPKPVPAHSSIFIEHTDPLSLRLYLLVQRETGLTGVTEVFHESNQDTEGVHVTTALFSSFLGCSAATDSIRQEILGLLPLPWARPPPQCRGLVSSDLRRDLVSFIPLIARESPAAVVPVDPPVLEGGVSLCDGASGQNAVSSGSLWLCVGDNPTTRVEMKRVSSGALELIGKVVSSSSLSSVNSEEGEKKQKEKGEKKGKETKAVFGRANVSLFVDSPSVSTLTFLSFLRAVPRRVKDRAQMDAWVSAVTSRDTADASDLWTSLLAPPRSSSSSTVPVHKAIVVELSGTKEGVEEGEGGAWLFVDRLQKSVRGPLAESVCSGPALEVGEGALHSATSVLLSITGPSLPPVSSSSHSAVLKGEAYEESIVSRDEQEELSRGKPKPSPRALTFVWRQAEGLTVLSDGEEAGEIRGAGVACRLMAALLAADEETETGAGGVKVSEGGEGMKEVVEGERGKGKGSSDGSTAQWVSVSGGARFGSATRERLLEIAESLEEGESVN